MDWKIYTENKIVARSGWYYLNRDVANDAVKFNRTGGVYIYTDRHRWGENTYKIGLTRRGEERIFEQGDASKSEDAYVVAFIPLVVPDSQFDKRIHSVLASRFECIILPKESSGQATEWIRFPGDVGPVGTVTLAIQHECNSRSIGREELFLTLSQITALDKALEQYESGNALLAELCPRFGKTVWAIALFDHTDKQVMVVCSYVHTALTSFRDQSASVTQFEHIAIAKTAEEVAQNTAAGLRSLVLVPLSDTLAGWKKKYSWINSLTSKFVFVDEADFGAHTAKQIKKVEYLCENS